MKTTKRLSKIVRIMILLTTISHLVIAQNPTLRVITPDPKLDSLLMNIAKTVILKYGEDGYYRENTVPEIQKGSVILESSPDYGRPFYILTYFYDRNQEQWNTYYLVRIYIWADTEKPYRIMFGNGYGYGLEERDNPTLRSASNELPDLPKMPYQPEETEWYNK